MPKSTPVYKSLILCCCLLQILPTVRVLWICAPYIKDCSKLLFILIIITGIPFKKKLKGSSIFAKGNILRCQTFGIQRDDPLLDTYSASPRFRREFDFPSKKHIFFKVLYDEKNCAEQYWIEEGKLYLIWNSAQMLN